MSNCDITPSDWSSEGFDENAAGALALVAGRGAARERCAGVVGSWFAGEGRGSYDGPRRSRRPFRRRTTVKEAVVVGYARTPVGKFGGGLSSLTAMQLGGRAIAGALASAGISPEDVGYTVMGHVLQAGQGMNVARQASLKAGIPVEVPAEHDRGAVLAPRRDHPASAAVRHLQHIAKGRDQQIPGRATFEIDSDERRVVVTACPSAQHTHV